MRRTWVVPNTTPSERKARTGSIALDHPRGDSRGRRWLRRFAQGLSDIGSEDRAWAASPIRMASSSECISICRAAASLEGEWHIGLSLFCRLTAGAVSMVHVQTGGGAGGSGDGGRGDGGGRKNPAVGARVMHITPLPLRDLVCSEHTLCRPSGYGIT